MRNEIDLEVGKTIGFRPTAYDVGVLQSIHESHPEMPDASSLIRKALREYQISRDDGGGMKTKVGNTAKLIAELISMVKDLVSSMNYVKAKIDGCESLENK